MKYAPLIDLLKRNNILFLENQSLHSLSNFEIGSSADIVIFPNDIDAFCEILSYLYDKGIKFFIVGKGTNLVFPDFHYNGVILCTSMLDKITIDGDCLMAECGASVTDCSILAIKNSLSGMEFFCGIPGSIGGAVYMNASAFDGVTSGIIIESLAFDLNTRAKFKINLEEHKFNDKKSIFCENKNLILLSSTFLLKKDFKEAIYLKALNFALRRISSQPLGKGSAGSAFKRPKNSYASKLIDESGLKGFTVGGAQISKKHAGFIVNFNNATANDIKELICITKERVYKKFNVPLDEEIIFVDWGKYGILFKNY